MLQDCRLALRSLRATPIIAAVAVLSLAVGIGANTAVFSLVDTLLLRELPVLDPDRLALLSTGRGDEHQQYSNLTVDQIRRYATNFDGVCAWAFPGKGTVGVGADQRMVGRQFISGDDFSMLGVRPAVGRLISAADDVRDGGPDGLVAVISYAFWQRHYAGAPQIIGSKLLFNRVPMTVIGVTPPAFLEKPFRLDFAGSGASPLRDPFERPLVALLAVVGLVLLIACANIANLMLARGAARRHELVVRRTETRTPAYARRPDLARRPCGGVHEFSDRLCRPGPTSPSFALFAADPVRAND